MNFATALLSLTDRHPDPQFEGGRLSPVACWCDRQFDTLAGPDHATGRVLVSVTFLEGLFEDQSTVFAGPFLVRVTRLYPSGKRLRQAARMETMGEVFDRLWAFLRQHVADDSLMRGEDWKVAAGEAADEIIRAEPAADLWGPLEIDPSTPPPSAGPRLAN